MKLSISHSKTIVVPLLGGLGNQMFQAAAGLALREQAGGRLYVDTGLLRDHRPGRHAVNRPYDLRLFAEEFAEAPLRWKLRHNAHGRGFCLKVISRLWRRMMPVEIAQENGFRWQPIDPNEAGSAPLYVQGLRQSWRYFSDHEDCVRKAFRFRRELPEDLLPLAEQLAGGSSIAIHVRRGDYVHNPKDAATLGFIGIEYYRRAVSALKEHINGNIRFFVFSDDMDWCKKNFEWLPGPVSYMELTSGDRPGHHLDFQLLSHAKRFIVSNSTFAWWAAWLSHASGKIVVAPKKWFRDPAIDSSDLCPPEWILV